MQGAERKIIKARGDLRFYEVRLTALSPVNQLSDRRRQLMDLRGRMETILMGRIEENRKHADTVSRRMDLLAERTLRNRQKKYSMLVERMKGLNPLDRLKSGYSFVSDEDGRAVTGISGINVGQTLTIHVTDGTIRADVKEIEKLDRI